MDTPKITESLKQSFDKMMELEAMKHMAKIQAYEIIYKGPIPLISPLMAMLWALEKLLESCDDDPEFREFIRTKILTAITPKGE